MGRKVGALEGEEVGSSVPDFVGARVGTTVGRRVGGVVGERVGRTGGWKVAQERAAGAEAGGQSSQGEGAGVWRLRTGSAVIGGVGCDGPEGVTVGRREGATDGLCVGRVGTVVGSVVG